MLPVIPESHDKMTETSNEQGVGTSAPLVGPPARQTTPPPARPTTPPPAAVPVAPPAAVPVAPPAAAPVAAPADLGEMTHTRNQSRRSHPIFPRPTRLTGRKNFRTHQRDSRRPGGLAESDRATPVLRSLRKSTAQR